MSPEASLQTWMPAIHAGMTKFCIFMFCRRAQANETLRGALGVVYARMVKIFIVCRGSTQGGSGLPVASGDRSLGGTNALSAQTAKPSAGIAGQPSGKGRLA